MSFEAHVTLSFPPAADASVRRFAEDEGWGLTCVELDRGAHPLQVMLTRHLGQAKGEARRAVHALVLGAGALPGVEVVRTKLEIELGAHPPADLGEVVYIEHHLKVRLPATALAALRRVAVEQGAHLSRNPLRRPEPGVEERFITQRFDPTSSRAGDTLGRLVASLAGGPWALVKTIRELVVHDDNLALDRGWAEGGTR
jgi:hypothetical protein